YVDPITNKLDWGIVRAIDGGIMGVHSLSHKEPIKIDNFAGANRDLAGKTRYADWQFIYMPATAAIPLASVR
ncbi:MAG: type II secretion system protein, partial [Betaproteobacteria bacterium]